MFLQTKSYSADKFVRHGSVLVRSEAMLKVALAWTDFVSAAYKPLITIHDDNDLYFVKVI